MSLLVIVRGLPGSGKSTLSKEIAKRTSGNHFEADMFFEDKDGKYNFNPALLGKAHSWCLESVRKSIASGHRTTIVSNTFTTKKELKPYLKLLEEFDDLSIEITEPVTRWSKNVVECCHRCTHNVPNDTMLKMQERWVDWTPDIPRVHKVNGNLYNE